MYTNLLKISTLNLSGEKKLFFTKLILFNKTWVKYEKEIVSVINLIKIISK